MTTLNCPALPVATLKRHPHLRISKMIARTKGKSTKIIHRCLMIRPAICRASADTSVRGSNGGISVPVSSYFVMASLSSNSITEVSKRGKNMYDGLFIEIFGNDGVRPALPVAKPKAVPELATDNELFRYSPSTGAAAAMCTQLLDDALIAEISGLGEQEVK